MSVSSATSSRAGSLERSGTSTPTLSTPSAALGQTGGDDGSKLKTLLSILKKFIGVADIANVRFSLPAQLLEPVPNLEYWTYIDRPETFVSIGDSDDSLGRMLAALRFWFTKDLKFIKGKPIKPYNSTLGEFFRCNWEVNNPSPPILGRALPQTTQASPQPHPYRLSYITEQTSHHPPVSAWWLECPEKGISAHGFDQIAANFTGTRIRIAPGEYNKGLFITLHNHGDETYNLTHPTAHLGGLLKGGLSITVADTCFVTCPKTGLKVILEYQEEGWLGKTKNLMKGVIFRYDPSNDTKTKIKDVKDDDVVARLEGCWHEEIFYTLGNKSFDKSDKHLMIDLSELMVAPKIIPPVDNQLANESRMLWAPVTEAILSKQYTLATDNKTEIEERQRQKAAERKAQGREWQPRFFTGAVTPAGRPLLTGDGKLAVQGLNVGDYRLQPNKELGA